MKKGDVVTIRDYSWSTKVVAGELKYVNDRNKKYTVVKIGCSFPFVNSNQFNKYRSDTVIQAIDGGEVVFIHGAFLEPVLPTHKVMVDIRQDGGWMYGQIVEISDELYKQIKK